MEVPTRICVMFLLVHSAVGIIRKKMLTKADICINSAQLPNNPSFTSVKDLIQCAHLHLASGATFMLVRNGADGALECRFTSTLYTPVSCGTGDVTVYADVHRTPTCRVSSVDMIQLRGLTYCVHKAPIRETTYDKAQRHCESIGGMVLELDTKDDLSVLHRLGSSTDLMWLGGDDHQVQGEYRWKNGGLVNPGLFAKDEPDQREEHCLGSFHGGAIADVWCQTNASVVCAVPPL